MSEKLQNIISNTIGILIIIFSVYLNLTTELSLEVFSSSILVGACLFLFKVSQSRKWLGRFLSSKINSDD